MGKEIREAFDRDSPLLAALIRDSFRDVAERFALTPENCPTHPSLCTEGWVRPAMTKGARYFVLQHEGRPCCCAALEKAGAGVYYLQRLAVPPSYRRRGNGEALVRKVMQEARAASAGCIEMGIISDQHELHDWYARLGFAERGGAPLEHLPFEVTFMSCRL